MSAIGLAWMVTDLMRISFVGRFLVSTGDFSMASSVSKPSMTLMAAPDCYLFPFFLFQPT